MNASGGDYSFKVSASESQLKGFEVHYSGSDGWDEADGDSGVIVSQNTDEVKVQGIHSKYNTVAFRLDRADDAEMLYNTMHCDGSALKVGLFIHSSKNLFVEGGDYTCAEDIGIYLLYGGNHILKNLYVQNNEVGIKVDQSTGNYFNDSYFYDNEEVGILLYGGDNNTIYNSNFNYEKYAISFTREAENNTILDVHFSDTLSYDIHHGFQSDSTRNGWNNVVIDTDFDDLYIYSDYRLIEKEELEITVTTNGTYVWNRVNTTIDSDRKVNSGLNSFWAGDSEEDLSLIHI